MKETPIKKIGEIFKVSSGGTPSRKRKEYFTNGTIRWVKTGDLKGRFVNEPKELITEEALQNSSAKIFPEKTVLIAMYGATIGACSILPFDAATNQACGALLPNKETVPEYIYYYLLSIKSELIRKGVGGAQPNISAGIIKDTKIPLPPLPEQRKIAAILDEADKLRQLNKNLITKYDELTQSLFLDMFGDPFKNESHDGKTVKDVTERITYGFTKPMSHVDVGIPIVTAKNVLFDKIDFKNTDKTDYLSYSELTNKSKPQIGDILMVKDGVTLGRPSIVEDDRTFCISQAVTLIIPNKSLIFPEFLLRYFLSTPVQRRIKGMAKGNAMPHLQITELAKFPVPTIDKIKQQFFVERIRAIKSQKAQAQESLVKSEELFGALLQESFGRFDSA